jgi:hypothetical protein
MTNIIKQNPETVAKLLWAERNQLAGELVQFAQKVVAEMDANPALRQKLLDTGFTLPELNNWERVGRGTLHEKLLLSSGRQYRSLSSCPLSVQKNVIENGVEIVEGDDTRIIPLDDLTPKQSAQAFTHGHIRSITEQKSWLREQKQITITVAPDWQPTKKGVVYKGELIPWSMVNTWIVSKPN